MARNRRNRRQTSWAVAGASALALAAGCAAPAVSPPAANLPAAGPQAAAAKFKAIVRDGHLVCDACGATLNAQGRHRIGETLVRAVKYMNDGEVFAQAPVTAGKITMKDVIVGSIGKIGYEKLGFKLPTQQAPAVGVDRVNQFPDPCGDDACWRNYVASNPHGCCVPDNVPIPDPPY